MSLDTGGNEPVEKRIAIETPPPLTTKADHNGTRHEPIRAECAALIFVSASPLGLTVLVEGQPEARPVSARRTSGRRSREFVVCYGVRPSL